MHSKPKEDTDKTTPKVITARVNVFLLTRQASGMDISIPGYQQVTITQHTPDTAIVNAHIYDKPALIKAAFDPESDILSPKNRTNCLAILYCEDWKSVYYQGRFTKDILGVLEILKTGDFS